VVKNDLCPLRNTVAIHQTLKLESKICKVPKYFEFKNLRFSMTSQKTLSIRKAEREGDGFLNFLESEGIDSPESEFLPSTLILFCS